MINSSVLPAEHRSSQRTFPHALDKPLKVLQICIGKQEADNTKADMLTPQLSVKTRNKYAAKISVCSCGANPLSNVSVREPTATITKPHTWA